MNEKNKVNLITTLSYLGLSEKEAALYVLLLRLPDASIPRLLKEAGVSRATLYFLLARLEQEWKLLTTKKVGKKTIYVVEPPEKLEQIIHDNEKEILRQQQALRQVTNDLRSLYLLEHSKPGIRFFEGPEGLVKAVDDTLTATEIVYTFLDVDATVAYADEINRAYVLRRQRQGIKKKLLLLDTPAAHDYVRTRNQQHTEIRFLPKGMNHFSTSIQIYNNKISFFTLRESNIFAMIIEDADIYRTHRSIFELVWKSSTNLLAL